MPRACHRLRFAQQCHDPVDDFACAFARRVGFDVVGADGRPGAHSTGETLEHARPVGPFAVLENSQGCVQLYPAGRKADQRIAPMCPVVAVIDNRFADDVDAGPYDRGDGNVEGREKAPAIGSQRELNAPVIAARVGETARRISTRAAFHRHPFARKRASEDVELDRQAQLRLRDKGRLQRLREGRFSGRCGSGHEHQMSGFHDSLL